MAESNNEYLCPKCGSEMEVGFLLDNAHLNLIPTLWIQGAVERSFWRLTRIRGKTKRMVESYRCVECGYLESYARGEWEGFPKS